MRARMAQQREIDAQTIAKLRDELSMTGNTTLSKMQEIVSKHDVSHSANTATKQTSKFNPADVREFERQLQEKDHTIQ